MRHTSRLDGDLAIDLDPAELARRRSRVLDRPWFWLRQVHGNRVVRAADDSAEAAVAPGVEADAVVSTSHRWALAIHTADCAPLALVSDEGVLGATHAGWRGIEAGVVESTVAQMRLLGAGAIHARLGPCIHAECYEFGARDLAAVVDRFGIGVASETTDGRPALDIPAAISVALRDAGVDRLDVDPTCTSCDPRFYSHRARGEAGRQATLVWMDERG